MLLRLLPLPPEVLLHGLLLGAQHSFAPLHGRPPLLLLLLPGEDEFGLSRDPVVLQLVHLLTSQQLRLYS